MSSLICSKVRTHSRPQETTRYKVIIFHFQSTRHEHPNHRSGLLVQISIFISRVSLHSIQSQQVVPLHEPMNIRLPDSKCGANARQQFDSLVETRHCGKIQVSNRTTQRAARRNRKISHSKPTKVKGAELSRQSQAIFVEERRRIATLKAESREFSNRLLSPTMRCSARSKAIQNTRLGTLESS